MISLSGYSLKDEQNKYGDIEIKTIGLKKGEKLHEKLAYSDNLLPTENKHILEAKEDIKMDENFMDNINILKQILISGSEEEVKERIDSFKII